MTRLNKNIAKQLTWGDIGSKTKFISKGFMSTSNQAPRIKQTILLKIILLLSTDNLDLRFYIKQTLPCKGVLRIFSCAHVEPRVLSIRSRPALRSTGLGRPNIRIGYKTYGLDIYCSFPKLVHSKWDNTSCPIFFRILSYNLHCKTYWQLFRYVSFWSHKG